jgi:hypothetical protein
MNKLKIWQKILIIFGILLIALSIIMIFIINKKDEKQKEDGLSYETAYNLGTLYNNTETGIDSRNGFSSQDYSFIKGLNYFKISIPFIDNQDLNYKFIIIKAETSNIIYSVDLMANTTNGKVLLSSDKGDGSKDELGNIEGCKLSIPNAIINNDYTTHKFNNEDGYRTFYFVVSFDTQINAGINFIKI